MTRSAKARIAFIAGMLLVAVTLATLMSMEPREPETTGFWILARGPAESPQYFAYINVGRGMDINVQPAWTLDPSEAWRFGEFESAYTDAQKYGGVPVELRKAYQ